MQILFCLFRRNYFERWVCGAYQQKWGCSSVQVGVWGVKIRKGFGVGLSVL